VNYEKKIDITENHLTAFKWIMHLADGLNSNFTICEKSGIDIDIVNECIAIFHENNLIILN
jgi:aminopeptidase-like protein